MAMRRADLDALGGFESVKDVLAEDFVLGRAVVERLGKRVVLGRSVVTCVSVRRALDGFVRRYARWNVMQHQCAGLLAYLGLLLENPTLLATVAAVSSIRRVPTLALAARAAPRAAWRRTRWPAACCAGAASRCARCSRAASRICCRGAAWVYGLVSRSIEWRSNRLVVLSGSRLRIKQTGGGWAKARLARAGAAR